MSKEVKTGLAELMDMQPEDLAKMQHDKLKNHVVANLEHVLRLINDGEYGKVEEACRFSADGDGYGQENHFIDFSYNREQRNGEGFDIWEAALKLRHLNGIVEKRAKKR